MNIELKKITISLALSEETTAFVADIYINGYKAGYAKNQGHGGNTDIHHYDPKGRQLITEAEAYCKTLPPDTSYDIITNIDLEFFIDDMINTIANEKENKKHKAKLLRDMEKGIVTGNDMAYSIIFWKGHTITSMLANPKGVEVITKKVIELKLKGETILNTNIPAYILGAISATKQ